MKEITVSPYREIQLSTTHNVIKEGFFRRLRKWWWARSYDVYITYSNILQKFDIVIIHNLSNRKSFDMNLSDLEKVAQRLEKLEFGEKFFISMTPLTAKQAWAFRSEFLKFYKAFLDSKEEQGK